MPQAKHKFPFEIVSVAPEINSELLEYFNGERTGFVQVGPEKYFFPYKYKAEATAFYNFQARADDIWICTVPRSGTTWTQELIWLVANNLDFDTASRQLLTERFPFFEFSVFLHPQVKKELLEEHQNDAMACAFIQQISQPGYEMLDQWPRSRRRFIKTHFPLSLLPPSVMEQQCKVIYVARNPKDVAVSYYHLNRLYRTQGYNGDFKRYWHYFERGLNPWLPYYKHINEALAERRPNFLFLNYEDMRKDLGSAITKVANFLSCRLSEEGMDNLINHLNIANFRLNKTVNGHEMASVGILNTGEQGFVRNGVVDGVQKEFADNIELLARANTWIKKKPNS